MKMSSMYLMGRFRFTDARMAPITRWNVAEAFFNPNSTRMYFNNSWGAKPRSFQYFCCPSQSASSRRVRLILKTPVRFLASQCTLPWAGWGSSLVKLKPWDGSILRKNADFYPYLEQKPLAMSTWQQRAQPRRLLSYSQSSRALVISAWDKCDM